MLVLMSLNLLEKFNEMNSNARYKTQILYNKRV